jgi:hypothetical protein
MPVKNAPYFQKNQSIKDTRITYKNPSANGKKSICGCFFSLKNAAANSSFCFLRMNFWP